MAETIRSVDLAQETQERYLTYAMSVIRSRALPDVRDGLKPVQRRILYTMYHNLHLHPEGRPRKCAKICGDVTGNYHPHGDVSVYEALVRLSQGWVMREPLVTGQGNFGSVDGDSPAAPRYTEAKLAPISERLLTELRQETVPMVENYDSTCQEPTVLPAQFPNILVNGAAGIAVGFATNIPPHNLGEVIRACNHLIDNPEATTAELMNKVKGPDFPLGGRITTERSGLRKIYEEGRGSITVQAEWKEETNDRKRQIIVTSIPYNVNKGKLEEKIGEIIAARKVPQLLNVNNESSEKEGLRIALDIKSDADPNLVMAYLYRHTDLQSSFAVNLTCLVPVYDEEGGKEKLKPERLGLKAILQHFLDYRMMTVRKRYEYELEQLKRRIHILEGFVIIFDALDEAIKIIRGSNGKADASEQLIARFELTEIQATAILDMQLYKIAQLEIQNIRNELKEKMAAAKKIEKILRSEKELWKVVKTEMAEVDDKHGQRRRTRMGSADDTLDFDPQAYVVRENANVVLTRDGWIKRVGRLKLETTRVREGDEVIAVIAGSTLDHVVFFADDGTAYTMSIYDVPATSGHGEPITKFFKLADQVRIIGAITTDERFTPKEKKPKNGQPALPHVLVVTEQGQTLRTGLLQYRAASTKLGRKYVRLTEGDKVVLVELIVGDEQSVFLASQTGRVIHFPIKDVAVLTSAGKGVIGMKLEKNDKCLGGAVIRQRSDALAVETSGEKTKEFRPTKYETTSRGGKGFEAVKRANFVRVIPSEIKLVNWDELEGKPEENGKKTKKNDQRSLFEE